MYRIRPREWVAFAAFALFAVYAAAEPILGANDCISLLEILLLLPYYGLLYFGTLPALVWIAIRRVALSRRLTFEGRRNLDLTIGFLGVLLLLEILAAYESPVVTLASRCLDFVPLFVLLIWWQVRIWPYARALRDAHS
ncbi:MAG TPA: hypothetical protein VGG89_01240 [Candidatus Baltobacteraceae bacterium]|jgi:hypothetical protein